METHDDDLKNYQNKLHQDDIVTDETLDCENHRLSNCCDAPFWNDTDVCSDCLEHADTGCQDCIHWEYCNNDNENRFIYKPC